jgi:hypothetical protein
MVVGKKFSMQNLLLEEVVLTTTSHALFLKYKDVVILKAFMVIWVCSKISRIFFQWAPIYKNIESSAHLVHYFYLMFAHDQASNFFNL